MKRHNKDKKERSEDVPEIFKDLWHFNFIEEISFSKVKNEIWPKIRIVMACEDENKVKMIKALLQKYEFPFSNLKIVSHGEKNGPETCKEKPEPSPSNKVLGNKPKIQFKVSGRGKLPPFKTV
ncbi:MAG: hypothetical protein ACYC3G_03780 [Minisyncoccota bacterium]